MYDVGFIDVCIYCLLISSFCPIVKCRWHDECPVLACKAVLHSHSGQVLCILNVLGGSSVNHLMGL